jgi:hypothetical protein
VSQSSKKLDRLLTKPKDFSWDDLISVLKHFDFHQERTGKSGGSRRKFSNSSGITVSFHEPHPQPTLKRYQVDQLIEFLTKEGYLS